MTPCMKSSMKVRRARTIAYAPKGTYKESTREKAITTLKKNYKKTYKKK